MSQYSPEVLAAIQSAQTMVEAENAAKAASNAVPADEDDIVDALKAHFGGGKLKSRKFWLSVAGMVLPSVIQILTGAVTWPVAVGGGVAMLITYVLSQSGIEKGQAQALGTVASQALVNKMAKKA